MHSSTVRPSNSIRPACVPMSPAIAFMRVLLPEPLSPTIAKISPFSMRALMPLCTGRAP